MSEILKRSSSIELYRVLMILGICYIHSFQCDGCRRGTDWLLNLLLPCVDGFVAISGWYGITFKPSKALSLFTISICSGICSVALALHFGTIKWGVLGTPTEISEILLGQWYLIAYLMLMLAAPALNKLIETLDAQSFRRIVWPLAGIALWSWLAWTPPFGKIIHNFRGAGGHGPLTLATVYCIMRYIAVKGLFADVRRRTWFVIWVACGLCIGGLTCFNLGQYQSPFAIVFAGSLFFIFKGLNLDRVPLLPSVAFLLAPSAFAIYLLHSHRSGFVFIKWFQTQVYPQCGCYLTVLLTGMTLFTLGFLVDVPRRIAAAVLGSPMRKVRLWVDGVYERLVNAEKQRSRGVM